MNRVWKRFLLKVSKPIAMLAYVILSMLGCGYIAYYFGVDPNIGVMFGAFGFVIFPMIFTILRDMYKTARYEVEQENRELINKIKGDGY